MIKVQIKRSRNGEIQSFSINGHANADEYGKDIVCAAVSVLSQTTLLGLHDIAKIEIDFKVQDGNLECKLPVNLSNDKRQKANLLLETMIMGIKNIYESYSEYIAIHDKEV
ncbi:ribosomal-processing cysteine protease Prp [Serpentinicella alkaliphila]|uniref:Ribosomal processing cysteine protease Prp n=1 Tax=Serpentinicella alkaliphila TaxID=1734049 RepID=A0A4R2TBA5_9FIRM|nr:ribosomal-processing cysteine protease Prp [Serpentinicella alkaliphila]QUH26073.1 ribosomal-processing cysteine protease Prp [Serpentinicella alkaliphila]TCP99086.1 hypothetical protein EDD79_103614 [Serpentinicella alkaliphila]